MFTDKQKELIVKHGLDLVYAAIQNAINGNTDELSTALEILELMRGKKG